jgi:hypothetical protein
VSDGRLASEIWVKAHLRRWNSEGFPTVLLRRGDPDGGAIILKIIGDGDICRILSQTRDRDGAIAWLESLGGRPASDGEVEAYVERAVRRDPDLWIIEVEDRRGLWQLDGKILK